MCGAQCAIVNTERSLQVIVVWVLNSLGHSMCADAEEYRDLIDFFMLFLCVYSDNTANEFDTCAPIFSDEL